MSAQRMKSPDTDTKAAADQTSLADGPRLVDLAGAARHLTVTPRFVRSLVTERRVPYLKIGKFVRFDLDDLDEWLDQCRIEVQN